jgi:hypothetical protein
VGGAGGGTATIDGVTGTDAHGPSTGIAEIRVPCRGTVGQ